MLPKTTLINIYEAFVTTSLDYTNIILHHSTNTLNPFIQLPFLTGIIKGNYFKEKQDKELGSAESLQL